MAAPTYTLPSIGSPNSTEDPLVRTALSDLKTLLTGQLDAANLAADSVAASEIVADTITNTEVNSAAAIAYSKLATAATGSALIGNAGVPTMTALAGDVTVGATGTTAIGATKVTAAMLAASTQSAYRTIFQSYIRIDNDLVAGTYMFSGTNPGLAQVSGTAMDGGGEFLPLVYFDDADYTVASLTQKLRVRVQIAANATAPAINFTTGLYPVTVAGIADNLTYTLGTVTSGSTVAQNTPSASTITQGNSGDFTIPADGAFAFGVVTSGTIANNSAVALSAQLQQRSV